MQIIASNTSVHMSNSKACYSRKKLPIDNLIEVFLTDQGEKSSRSNG